MASHYKNFLRLLESWPVDKSKQNRDLGQYIRDQVKKNFGSGAITTNINEKECEETYNCLKRISDNHYSNLYKRRSETSATGLTAEQCNAILSTEFLNYINKRERNLFRRMIQ